MKTCFNFTLIHMMWTPQGYGRTQRDEEVVLRQEKQYAEHVVLNLKIDVNAQVTIEYNDYQGQHPEDYEEDRDEEYNPRFEDPGGMTPVMKAIRRHSYGMAAVLGDLGADWHTLTDHYHERTAYEMLDILRLSPPPTCPQLAPNLGPTCLQLAPNLPPNLGPPPTWVQIGGGVAPNLGPTWGYPQLGANMGVPPTWRYPQLAPNLPPTCPQLAPNLGPPPTWPQLGPNLGPW